MIGIRSVSAFVSIGIGEHKLQQHADFFYKFVGIGFIDSTRTGLLSYYNTDINVHKMSIIDL